MTFWFIQKGFEHNYFILFDGQHYQITGVYYKQEGRHEFAPRVTGWSRSNLTTDEELMKAFDGENIRKGADYFPSNIRKMFLEMAFKDWKKV
jgi:hypothetical protein